MDPVFQLLIEYPHLRKKFDSLLVVNAALKARAPGAMPVFNAESLDVLLPVPEIHACLRELGYFCREVRDDSHRRVYCWSHDERHLKRFPRELIRMVNM